MTALQDALDKGLKTWVDGRRFKVQVSILMADTTYSGDDFLTLHVIDSIEAGYLLADCEASRQEQTQKAIAGWLGVSPAHLSETLERLRKANLLKARFDPRDRRRQFWEMTPLGRTEVQRLRALAQPLVEAAA